MKRLDELKPGHRSLRPPNARAGTLRQLLMDSIQLRAVCRRCRHQGLLFTADLAARFGSAFPVDDLMDLLRCTECGARGATSLYQVTR